MRLESLEQRQLLAAEIIDIRPPGTLDLEAFGQFAELGSNVIFRADDNSYGSELWKSDGTNTTLVADINPGTDSSSPFGLTVFQGNVYFSANDGRNGSELWRTDGTNASLVADINTGSGSSGPSNLIVVGANLFFTANDGSSGTELWKYDGTTATRVADINSGSPDSSIRELTDVGGTLFFTANDGSSGQEVWSSDGSTATRVTDINTTGSSLSTSSSRASLTNLGGELIFSATTGTGNSEDYELYKLNGSTPTLVSNINANGSSTPQQLTVLGNEIIFTADDGTTGRELWKTDGTTATRIADIRTNSSSSSPSLLTQVGNNVFFSANDGVNGTELWKTDGQTASLVSNIRAGNQNSFPNNLTDVAGTLFFTANDGATGVEIWKSDGITTTRVSNIDSGNNYDYPGNLTNVGGTLFYSATDANDDEELYKTDGTTVTPLPGSGNGGGLPTQIIDAGGTAFFRANNGASGFELFSSGGASGSTRLVRDILAGSGDALSADLDETPVNLNGTVFFIADDGSSGSELWKTNGTLQGTSRVRDIRSGSGGSSIDNLTALNDMIVFRANGGSGTRLWKSDGTFEGTVEVTNFTPNNLTNVNGTLYFTGDNGSTGDDGLYTFDGTTVTLVADLLPNASVFPRNLTNVGGTLFFTLSDASYQDRELWSSDGVTADRVRDINQGTPSSNPNHLTDVNGTLYFTANDGNNGIELWKSNGTEGGTVLVQDIQLGGSSNPSQLTNVDGTLFFSADDGINGRELWKSDSNGTVLVSNINPSGSSNPQELTAVAGSLLFTANDGTNGVELWQSRGGTTAIASDIFPGRGSSEPRNLTAVGNDLFFTAAGPTRGRELAVFQPPQLRVGMAVTDATGNAFAQPGEVLTYTLTIQNQLSEAQTNVVITGAAPAGTSFVPSSASIDSNNSGGTVAIVKGDDPGENSFEINIGSLPGTGGPLQVSYQVRVNGPTPGVTTITNSAQARSDQRPTFDSSRAEIPVGLYVVDSLADNTTADGMLTLREAILAANSDMAVGDAAAGSGADTIVFAPNLQGTINLSTAGDSTIGSSAFGITTPITILGDNGGTGITLDAGGNKRHFYVGTNGSLALDTLTLSGGNAGVGGAIHNVGNLNITNSTLSGNTATNGTNGGGGAIFNSQELVISNSTISGNTSAGGGGGVTNADGNVTATNVTFASNTATIGGALSDLTTNLSRRVILENSILADSINASSDLRTIQGLIDARNTLVESGGSAINGVNVGNIIDVDPQLGPLAANGGPTRTHKPALSSPVVDAGNNTLATATGLTTDQTDATRLFGTVDIGSVELQEPVQLIVSTLVDEDDGDYSPGDLSLREAIALATARTIAGITFDPVLTASGDAILDLTMSTPNSLESSALTVNLATIIITGPTGPHGITIRRPDSAAKFRLLHVTNTGFLTLRNLTLSGGVAQGGGGGNARAGGGGGGGAGMGGGIFNQGVLTLEGVTMTNNQAIGGPGGTSFIDDINGGGARGGGAAGGFGGALSGGNNGSPGTSGGFAGGGGGGGGYGQTGGFSSGGAGGAGGFGAGGGGGGQFFLGGGNVGAAGAGGFGGGGAFGAAGGGGAGMGGAIFNEGRLNVLNSTFSGNSAVGGNGGGGAQHAGAGLGGAVFTVNNSFVEFTHSTIASNTVGGANADGGGIYSLGDGAAARIFLSGNIIADSVGAANDLVVATNAGGSHTSFGGANLVESQSGFAGNIATTADPQLIALGDNGGPTATHALPSSSPAIDTGVPSGSGFDQRGTPFLRVSGVQRDIGAFEFQPDTFRPDLLSITRQIPTATLTNADSLVFRAVFSEDVNNVNGFDFVASGGVTGQVSINTSQINPRIYDITVAGGSVATYNGTLGIDLAALNNITDAAGNALTFSEPPLDETYTLDNTAPRALAFTRLNPTSQTTTANTLEFRATFDSDVIGVDTSDFVASGGTTASVSSVNAIDARTYAVTLSGGDLTSFVGSVGLDIAGGSSITDLAGNSLVFAEPATDETFTLNNMPPTLQSFARQNPMTPSTSADTLVFRATFDADALNVDATDFLVDGLSTATVSNVTPVNASTYDITVSGGNLAIFNGTVGLNVNASNDIVSRDGSSLTSGEPTTDETYSVANVVTQLLRFNRQTPSLESTNVDTLVFRAIFGDDVLHVDAADFEIEGGTTAGISDVTSVDARNYDITVSGGDLAGYNGTVGLNLSNANDITNTQGIPLVSGNLIADQTFTVDNIAPQLQSFARQTPSGEFTSVDTLVFRATFDSDVANVDASDFVVDGTTAGITNITSVDARRYDITVSGGDLAGLSGTVGLNVSNANNITDLAGNALTAGEPSTDETYSVDNIAPQVQSFTRQTPMVERTGADSLVFRATFNEAVTNVDSGDFRVNGATTATVTSVVSSGVSTYDITVSGGDLADFNGVVGLDFATTDITDLAGNPFVAVEPSTDETFTVDNISLVVDTLSDVSDGNTTPGNFSLREAIEATNQSAVLNRVRFSSSLSGGTIQVASQLPTITRDLTILGLGAGLLTIDAGNGPDNTFDTGDGYRIFEVNDSLPSQINVVISGLTLTGGDANSQSEGGAILNRENLTFRDGVVSANATDSSGGGVASTGTVSIVNSTLNGNRAGIVGGGFAAISGTSIVSNSTISNNTARQAGGVAHGNFGSFTMTNSTVSGNTATERAAGLLGTSGTGTILFSTIAGNTVNGVEDAIAHQPPDVRGGSVYRFDNTIVSGNVQLDVARPMSGDYNLFSTNVAISGIGNLINTDPMLGPLQDNQGATQTRAPAAQSPAINAGNPEALPGVGGIPLFDQRGTGFDRVLGGRTDIGAHEVFAAPDPSPRLLSFRRQTPNTAFTTDDTLVFRALFNEDVRNVDAADFTVSGGSTASITSVVAVDGQTYDITVSGGDLAGFNGSVGLNVAGNNNIVDPQANALVAGEPLIDQDFGLFHLSSVVVSTLNDLVDDSFAAGQLSLREAILAANALPNVTTITFDNGLSSGTINIDSELPTINRDVTITGLGSTLLTIDAGNGLDNTFDTGDGHRIFNINDGNDSSELNVQISGITVTGGDMIGEFVDGGAIHNTENLTLRDLVLSGNAAPSEGGAIFSRAGGALSLIDSTVVGNSAFTGAGIHFVGPTLNVVGSTLAQNRSNSAGGGIYISNAANSNLSVTNSTFSGNSGNAGGGIFTASGATSITHSTFTGNTDLFGAGAIFGSNTYQINSSIVSGTVSFSATPTGNYNLFSTTVAITGNGNLQNMDPKLGPLQNNGGPTQTHALQSDSPAINMGDPNAVAGVSGVPQFDQRGTGFPRVESNRIDIGAFESNQPPTLLSFNRQTPADALTNADSLVFRATFNENVTSVDTTDFAVTGASTAIVTNVTPVGGQSVYDITVAQGNLASFNGPVGLAVVNATDITDPAGNALTATPPPTNEQYTLDNQAPTLSLTRSNPTSQFTTADSLVFRATFSEDVSGVDASDFVVSGGTTASVSNVNSIDSATFDITVTGGDLANFNGTVGLDIAGATDIADGVGNLLSSVEPATDQTYELYHLPSITANTLSDGVDGNFGAGQLTLREALLFADALPSLTTIDFSSSLAGGTIALTQGALSAGGNVTIQGLGADQLTISGENVSQVLLFGAGTYIISGLDIANGRSTLYGGAIDAAPGHNLTIRDSVIRNSHSTFIGGGLRSNGGTLTLVNSAVINNTAAFQSGGIDFFNTSNSQIINSTISGNSVTSSRGGGFVNTASPNRTSLVTLTNVTMAGNTAPSGGSFITTSGSGAFESKTRYRNSIFTTTSESNIVVAGFTARNESLGYNISSDGSGNLTATGDQPSTNPMLEPLQDNGGPTPTHALLAASPAINMGSNALAVNENDVPLQFDQRSLGFNRIIDSVVDVGAFESGVPRLISFERRTPQSQATNADTLIFRATFDKDVIAVDAADFEVNGSTASVANVEMVNNQTYLITVSGGDLANLNGTVGLNLASNAQIADQAFTPIPLEEPPVDETFTLDNTLPSLASFLRQTPASQFTNADTLVFRATFDEDVINVDASDFDVSGTTTATVTAVASVDARTYDITIGGGDLATHNGVVGLDLSASSDIADLAGNSLPTTEPVTDQNYTVDNIAPQVVSFTRHNPMEQHTNADSLVFRLVVDEDVIGIDVSDFLFFGFINFPFTTATVTSVNAINGRTYDITVSGGDLSTYAGAVGLFVIEDFFTDLAGNSRSDSFNSELYYVNSTEVDVRRQNPMTVQTNSDSLVFRASFSQDVGNIDASDFTVTAGEFPLGPATTATVTNVTPIDGKTFDVTVSGGDLAGYNDSVSLGIAGGHSATDAAGNPTTLLSFSEQEYLLDNIPPTLQSVVRLNPASEITNADTLVFRASFTEEVSNVNASDFIVSGGTTATVTNVVLDNDDAIYNITVSGGDLASFNGTVGIDLSGGHNISDFAGNVVPAVEPATDQTYTVDNTAPGVESFNRHIPLAQHTSADELTFRITFTEAVTGVDASDFLFTEFRGDRSTATVTGVTPVNTRTYDVTVSGGDLSTYAGRVQLQTRFDFFTDVLTDLAGNGLFTPPPTDNSEPYFVNSTLADISRQNPMTLETNADTLVFRVAFSQVLTNVDATDFVVQANSGPVSTATATQVTPVNATTYDVTVSGGDLASFNGEVRLRAAANHNMTDGEGAVTTILIGLDQPFDVENDPPRVSRFVRLTPDDANTNADVLVFRMTLDQRGIVEDSVDIGDFVVTGGTTATVTSVSGPVGFADRTEFDLTVSLGDLASFNGVVGIDLSPSSDIADVFGNTIVLEEPPIDETFTVDNIAPQVESIAYDDGSAQRSVIRSVTVNFDSEVAIDPGAFVLTTKSGTAIPVNAPVLSVVGGKTRAVLTFSGNQVDSSGSLIDGNYRLSVLDTHVRDLAGNSLDGNKDGSAGTAAVDDFFRLYGDSDGDRDVDGLDFLAFRSSFRRRQGDVGFNAAFDADRDGDVDSRDFLSFRSNYRKRLTP